MIKSKVASILLAGTVLTGGVLTALTWTGGQSLTEAQQIATNFNNKAVEYIQKAKELEKLAEDQNTDINKLVSKVQELKAIKGDLENQIARLEELVKTEEGNGAEAHRLEEELTKANAELTRANAEAEAHKTAIENTLDASIFESLTVPERIDITEALEDSAQEEAPALKYNYNIDVATNLQSNKQAEGKAKAEAVVIPFIEEMELTAGEKEAIKEINITVRESGSDYKYTVTFYTDSDNNQTKLDNKLNNYRSDAMAKGITSLSASIKTFY